ncbi:restriction endonuclease subunit S [Zobellella sp. An-6]|uniref:restriction endonuclease subunit S n=1 Tax=Zobellella sp. An-6 TaxID=3400218 RepID=UPI004042FFDA
MSEISVAIPNYANWPLVPLSKICSIISRGTAPVYVESSDIKAIGQRCITHADFDASVARPHSENAMSGNGVLRAKKGDVLLNSTGTGTIGRSCIFDEEGEFIVDGHVTLLRPLNHLIDSRWLNILIRSSWFQTHMERYCYTGSTNQLELSRSQLSLSAVAIPPFPEQNKIGDILDTLDDKIRQTEAIIAKLQQVKQGLLHDLLTRGIGADGQLRPAFEQAPELYKASPLGWIPKEWEVSALSDIATIRSGATPLRTRFNRYFDNGRHLWVKTLDLNEDILVTTDEKITDLALSETSCFLLSPNTILVAMYGGWEQIGRTAILGATAATNQAISALSLSDSIYPEYALRAIQHGRHRWKKIAASTRKDPNITKSDIEQFIISLPQCCDEQRYICERYTSMITRIHEESSILMKLKNQKSGLMDDLLTGRVRVTALLAPQPPAQ